MTENEKQQVQEGEFPQKGQEFSSGHTAGENLCESGRRAPVRPAVHTGSQVAAKAKPPQHMGSASMASWREGEAGPSFSVAPPLLLVGGREKRAQHWSGR